MPNSFNNVIHQFARTGSTYLTCTVYNDRAVLVFTSGSSMKIISYKFQSISWFNFLDYSKSFYIGLKKCLCVMNSEEFHNACLHGKGMLGTG